MDKKEEIIAATTALINASGENIDKLTVRGICKRAGVGLGLINYYFGNKDALIETCVERIINGIVENFVEIGANTEMSPFEKLDYLGNLTFTFLFEHQAVSRISVLTDIRAPKAEDNTQRTLRAFIPLVAACRPDWSESEVKSRTFCLISSMQTAFIRHGVILKTQGVNLKNASERKCFHTRLLRHILGVTE